MVGWDNTSQYPTTKPINFHSNCYLAPSSLYSSSLHKLQEVSNDCSILLIVRGPNTACTISMIVQSWVTVYRGSKWTKSRDRFSRSCQDDLVLCCCCLSAITKFLHIAVTHTNNSCYTLCWLLCFVLHYYGWFTLCSSPFSYLYCH